MASDQPDMVSKFLKIMKDVHCNSTILFLIVCLFVGCNLQARFDHPYISFLFYGTDTVGDFIPIKQLREKYNRPRYEVPTDPEDEELQ